MSMYCTSRPEVPDQHWMAEVKAEALRETADRIARLGPRLPGSYEWRLNVAEAPEWLRQLADATEAGHRAGLMRTRSGSSTSSPSTCSARLMLRSPALSGGTSMGPSQETTVTDPDWLALFTAPHITTVDGVHRDQEGRTYKAIDVDGEVTYVLEGDEHE